jgi:hypothetical protein
MGKLTDGERSADRRGTRETRRQRPVLGSAEGSLGVDDPSFAPECGQVDVGKVDDSARVGALEGGEHLAGEQDEQWGSLVQRRSQKET